ncbi:MAG: methylated-DNA--[protein]-cysteine S-methyltransferase [Chromatiales bacterium]|nr:methylated-DNA--[protein]-cysteine S-methyltransferase [Chromatiales bacterium]
MPTANINTPFGPLGVVLEQGVLCGLTVQAARQVDAPQLSELERVQVQIDRYFADPEFQFDLPLRLDGTPFQQRVWQALREIPVGQVSTYGELAKRLQSSAQAVGNACRANPVSIIVPCHRVVSASGIGGYAGAVEGDLLAMKRSLLRHEGVVL